MGASNAEIDQAKCRHYAQFAAQLDAIHFDILYWFLFLLVVLMLFCSSWYYGRYAPCAVPHFFSRTSRLTNG